MRAALKPRAKELMCCGSRSNAASSMAMYGAMPGAAILWGVKGIGFIPTARPHGAWRSTSAGAEAGGRREAAMSLAIHAAGWHPCMKGSRHCLSLRKIQMKYLHGCTEPMS
jgi:hypothetical protein